MKTFVYDDKTQCNNVYVVSKYSYTLYSSLKYSVAEPFDFDAAPEPSVMMAATAPAKYGGSTAPGSATLYISMSIFHISVELRNNIIGKAPTLSICYCQTV